MIHNLSTTLKAILDDSSLPVLVRDADVAFERPGDSYSPSTPTINLFLYDVRENTELRDNEPVIERQNGIATIRRAPLRVACTYQVTAWSGSGLTGEVAILLQQELLGAALRVFVDMPVIPEAYLQGSLINALYPLPLVTAQMDLVRNPAEFWTAMGGKLRPSFTVTATIALESTTPPVVAPEVTSKEFIVSLLTTQASETIIEIGGTVRDAQTQVPIEAVDLTLVELGLRSQSDRDGRFRFSGVVAGSYSVRAVRQGFSTVTQTVQVPGLSPTAFDIDLSLSS